MQNPPSTISFRRFLLSRLLLLMLPILFGTVALTYSVTYRKARSALLETARQNLTESAIRYGDQLGRVMTSLTHDISTHAQLLGQSSQPQVVLEQLNQQSLPYRFHCLRLYPIATPDLLATQDPIASTCETQQKLDDITTQRWPKEQPNVAADELLEVDVLSNPPVQQKMVSDRAIGGLRATDTLNLRLTSPVYQEGQLTYLLIAEVGLSELTSRKRSSLVGSPIVIDDQQRVLFHPIPEQVGGLLQEQPETKALQPVFENAIRGRNASLHLFPNGEEMVAGYTAIASPLPQQTDEQWVIIAFTRLDAALAEVKAIRRWLLALLLVLTLALVGTSMLIMLYLTRALAQPIERLRDAVLNEHQIQTRKIPQTSPILEFNQLTDAINNMIRRLVSWAEELEGVWQEARQANQLKNEFLAGISDQLRTPLNGSIGAIQILKDELYETPEEQAEFLAIAEATTLQLKNLIDDILTLSLLERGEAEVDLERFDLNVVLQQVLPTQTKTASEKKLAMKTQDFPDTSIWVYGDRQKFQRVLNSILNNAIKFTSAGVITLTLDILAAAESNIDSPSNQIMRFMVQDTGIGIAPERQPYLFEPFTQGTGELYTGVKNAGMGLAIAQNLMTMMGGDIALYSPGLDQGTCIWVDLPTAEKIPLSESG